MGIQDLAEDSTRRCVNKLVKQNTAHLYSAERSVARRRQASALESLGQLGDPPKQNKTEDLFSKQGGNQHQKCVSEHEAV